ncbi:allergen V5/Tpx-1-like protein [Caballeronia catudaia]|uniref:Allergen V5/Tpx-1-like protein n=1 Tax=Caballeronia catudaia TaxID=1777136 RepID=A0A158D6R4_9BURK|nr:CAP domain-containing protein [Caballeronia catudaia]SAK90268.1 allergen V5/Tpx-1-like protein [Caballeronia catudaia]
MTIKSNFKLSMAAIAASLLVGACGGGGGGDNASSGAAPASGASAPTGSQTTSGVAPRTSVATPTYAAGSFQIVAFNQINAYRNAMGVGMLSQDPILDTSAQAHSLYLSGNLSTGAINSLPHDEITGNANYYADTPLARARKAGAPTTEYVGENVAAGFATTAIADAADCVGQALASVYHLVSLTYTQETIGLGYGPGSTGYPNYTCVSDFGTSTGVTGTPTGNSLTSVGGQQIASTAVVHSPYASEIGVALSMRPEASNPAPDVSAPGRPILVRVSAAQGIDTLTVSQYALTDSSGSLVATRILVPSAAVAGSTATTIADPNNLLPSGTAVLLPLSALKANTTYTVAFVGARDGAPVSATWSFTTASK